MRIEIHCVESIKASEECRVRVVLFNDGYSPVEVSRNALVGPNVEDSAATGAPRPDSVEPTFGGPDQPLTLQPFTFYGRERTFSGLALGEVQLRARYRPASGDELTAAKSLQVVPD